MDRDSPYYSQVSLLIRMLPVVATEPSFALKGGTAINLFVRDFPRLSVDIDLAYLPLEPRNEALANVKAALQRIVDLINKEPENRAVLQDHRLDELRIVVTSPNATIKIEVSPVARGTLHKPENYVLPWIVSTLVTCLMFVCCLQRKVFHEISLLDSLLTY